jgi:hypothetical protein
MRVLFTLLPAIGSLHPLLPVARALVQAGHQVAFCSSRAFGPEIEAHGFRAFAAGLDFLISDRRYIEILCQEAGLTFPPLTGKARFAWVTNQLFIGAAGQRMLPDLVALARDWGADLIVRESLEFSGCVAAERLGLPHAAVAAAAVQHTASQASVEAMIAADALILGSSNWHGPPPRSRRCSTRLGWPGSAASRLVAGWRAGVDLADAAARPAGPRAGHCRPALEPAHGAQRVVLRRDGDRWAE